MICRDEKSYFTNPDEPEEKESHHKGHKAYKGFYLEGTIPKLLTRILVFHIMTSPVDKIRLHAV